MEFKVTTEIEPNQEYNTKEIAKLLGVTTRAIQKAIKVHGLKYTHKQPRRHGGYIVTGNDLIVWLLEYRCRGLIKFK